MRSVEREVMEVEMEMEMETVTETNQQRRKMRPRQLVKVHVERPGWLEGDDGDDGGRDGDGMYALWFHQTVIAT